MIRMLVYPLLYHDVVKAFNEDFDYIVKSLIKEFVIFLHIMMNYFALLSRYDFDYLFLLT